MSTIDATWEDTDKIRLDFPYFDLKDKVVVNGGGIDMNMAEEIAHVQEEGPTHK